MFLQFVWKRNFGTTPHHNFKFLHYVPMYIDRPFNEIPGCSVL